MSTNEEKQETNGRAPAETEASAQAAVRHEQSPSTPVETQSKTSEPATEPPRPKSRFYSRLNRGKTKGSAPAATEAPVFSEGIDPEDLEVFTDNLPVRATIAEGIEASEDEVGGRPREREHRGERRGRDRDRERGGRGRDRDRGRGRSRGRDRDSEEEGDRNRRRDRGRNRHDEHREAGNDDSADIQAPEAPAAAAASEAPAGVEPTPGKEPAKSAPRRVRFEDAPADSRRRDVQEFKPSRDGSYARDAARARKSRSGSAQPEKRPTGLLGWMKSVFSGGEEETSQPARAEPEQGERGPRPRSAGGPRSQSGGGSGQEGRPKRRRRRRGGRNRNRNRPQGDAPSGPATD